jgi:phosphoribosylaminoimidazole-succinocarboxamide synthase
MMTLIRKGKTKDVYKLDDGNILLKFKDDATGADGVFDPGANSVGLSINGFGKENLRLTSFFFEKLNEIGIPTHYITSNTEENTMIVQPAAFFGNGLEVICRFRAAGSFVRRYGEFVREGQPLHNLVEFTLKDDERGDPFITKDTLATLNILTDDEYEKIKTAAQNAACFIRELISEKGMELYDIKLEYGRVDGEIILIDEISAGNMRVYKGGRMVEPMELSGMLLE